MRRPAVSAWLEFLSGDVALVAEIERCGRSAMAVLAPRPMTTPSRCGAAPNVVKGVAGRTGERGRHRPRRVGDTRGSSPAGTAAASFSRQPQHRSRRRAARPVPMRSELVVCAATVRLSELAPVSVKPFWVAVEPCNRANGVTNAAAARARCRSGSRPRPGRRTGWPPVRPCAVRGCRPGMAICARHAGCRCRRSPPAPSR